MPFIIDKVCDGYDIAIETRIFLKNKFKTISRWFLNIIVIVAR